MIVKKTFQKARFWKSHFSISTKLLKESTTELLIMNNSVESTFHELLSIFFDFQRVQLKGQIVINKFLAE